MPGGPHRLRRREQPVDPLGAPPRSGSGRTASRRSCPGIESWYSHGQQVEDGPERRASTRSNQVSDHVNMILRYIPYVQANFVLGLDDDAGEEPFELTKRFVDKTPGAFPAYSLLSAFGQAAPLNLEPPARRARAPVPVPLPRQQPRDERAPEELHLGRALRPRHRPAQVLVLLERRWAAGSRANEGSSTRSLNFVRAVSSEGFGRIRLRHDDPRPARHRSLPCGASSTARPRASLPSTRTGAPGPRPPLGRAARGSPGPRPERVPEVPLRGAGAGHHPVRRGAPTRSATGSPHPVRSRGNAAAPAPARACGEAGPCRRAGTGSRPGRRRPTPPSAAAGESAPFPRGG